MNKRNDTKQKKNPVKGILGVIGFFILTDLLSVMSAGELDIYFIIGLVTVIVVAALVIIVIVKIVKTVKKQASSQSFGSYKDREAEVTEKVYTPLKDNYSGKTYYESTDVFDTRERDRARRIEQLKVFLQNGIIEKDEYYVLLKKYEREG